jgi:hypothetical protein
MLRLWLCNYEHKKDVVVLSLWHRSVLGSCCYGPNQRKQESYKSSLVSPLDAELSSLLSM